MMMMVYKLRSLVHSLSNVNQAICCLLHTWFIIVNARAELSLLVVRVIHMFDGRLVFGIPLDVTVNNIKANEE